MRILLPGLLLQLVLPLLSRAQTPSFVSSVPAQQALTGNSTGPIRLTFSGPVVDPAAIRVNTDLLRGQRAGTLSGVGTNQVEFRPAQPFAPGERVSVSMPASVSRPAQVLEFRAAAGRGRAIFGPPQTASPDINSYPAAVVAGDVDNDGDVDLIIGERNRGRVCFNDGQGNFRATTRQIPLLDEAGDLRVADYNGDGKLDILVSSSRIAGVRLNLGDGQGGFDNYTTVYAGTSQDVQTAIGDFNADGLTDAVFAEATETGTALYLMLGTESSAFVRGEAQLLRLSARDVGVADMDEDGDLDLLFISDTTLGICLNDGNGQFTVGATIAVNELSGKLTVGDFTGDGHADVVCTSYNTPSVSLVSGTGTGGLRAVRNVLALSRTQQVSSGDMDGDGDLDLLVTNDRGITQVLLNDGTGQFSAASAILIGFDSFYMADAADLNGDGILDVYTAKQVFNPNNPRGIDVFFNQPLPITSVIKAVSPNQLVMYPNPAHGQVALELPGSSEPAQVEVRDALGRLVRTLTVVAGSVGKTVLIPLTGLESGLYVVQVRISTWRGIQRLLVE